MPPLDLDNVGDEPIYCETQHDDVLYSGSEDDYYEAPEHRRLRIEAKAVQFLNGNLPYLLSAKLHGPFDAKSWNNPWKSKRAQRQAVRVESQSRRSMTPVKAARSHGPSMVIDDLPDTQRTSLYPLPSPEITNPPSTKKNPYMAEEEYNRIKTWRETIKKVPSSTDAFWATKHDKTEQPTGTRKRAADQGWLHKRDSKKTKSRHLRMQPLEDSPSHTAAKTKKNVLQGRHARTLTQSASGSSKHKDELVVHWAPDSASFDASRMVNRSISTPDELQTANKSDLSASHLLAHSPESSDDELSMPSVAPSRNTSRSPTTKSFRLTAENTPSRRKKRDGDGASCDRELFRLGRLRRSTAAQSLPLPYYDIGLDAERSQTKNATSVSATQTVRQDSGEATKAASDHISMSRGMAQDKAMRAAKNASSRAVGASQQDNSFHFHQAVPRHLSPSTDSSPMNPSPKNGLDELTPIFSATQCGGPATATGQFDLGLGQPSAEGGGTCAPVTLDCRMGVDPSDHQNLPLEVENVASQPDKYTEAGSANDEKVATQPQVAEALPVTIEGTPGALRQPQHEGLQISLNAEPGLSSHAYTQELSPVSMQDKLQATVTPTIAAKDPPSTNCLIFNDVHTSHPERSTYIDANDTSAASEEISSFDNADKGGELISQSADDPHGEEWMTYVNTQDVTGLSSEDETGSKDAEELPIVEQGPDDISDPDWSTVVNTQDYIIVKAQYDRNVELEDGVPPAMGPSEHKITDLAADGTDSDSEWSSYLSGSSQEDIKQTGRASKGFSLAEAPSLESKASPKVLLEVGTGACAEDAESHEDIRDREESQLSIGGQQDSDAATQRGGDREAYESENGRQGNVIISIEDPQDVPASGAPMEQFEEPLKQTEEADRNFDRTTASFESPISSVEEAPLQSPWVKGDAELSMSVMPSKDTALHECTSRIGLIAGQALASSPAGQTPWMRGRLLSPDFSLSVKRFSDFMKPSPSKNRNSSDRGILRSSGDTARVLFGTPMPAKSKPQRRVTFAPLPGEEEIAFSAAQSKDVEIYVEEDLSYFDAKGNKTASIRMTRARTRALSPPPSDVNTADADELSDHDHKFARHFDAMSKRKKNRPWKTHRLLPSDSQQIDNSQAIDAMAEAFIQASQTRKKSSELAEAVDDNSRLVQSSSEKTSSPVVVNSLEQRENLDPVDDVSAVLDNIDDFLDNSWGFDTSLNVDLQKKTPIQQQAKTMPSRFAHVGDPMLAMHANVWAD